MKTDMVSYYAERAAEYERIYAKPERQPDLQRLRQILGSLFQGRDVLEISCGTGYWTEAIASSARTMVATDINDEMLNVARNKHWASAAIEFCRADSYALPDFGRHFSGGFAGFWWSHIPQRKLAGFLAGFHARLEPGALVAIADNRYVEGSSTPVSRVDANGDSFQTRQLADGSIHEVLKNFPSPSELESVIGRFAAQSISITLLDYFWVLTYRTR